VLFDSNCVEIEHNFWTRNGVGLVFHSLFILNRIIGHIDGVGGLSISLSRLTDRGVRTDKNLKGGSWTRHLRVPEVEQTKGV